MNVHLELTISGASTQGKTKLRDEIIEFLESKYAVSNIQFLDRINLNAEHTQMKIEDAK